MILEAELQSNPEVLVRDTKGNPVAVPLMGGNYRFKVFLIHELIENGESKLRVLNEPLEFDGSAQRGQLTSTFNLEIRAIPTKGRYKVGIIAQAIEGPRSLKKFEGLFDFGTVSYLTGKRTGRLLNEVIEDEGKYKLADQLQVQTFRIGPNTTGYKKPGYEVKPNVQMRFAKYGKETTSEREVFMRITACVVDSSGNKVEREPFIVHKIDRDQNGERVKERVVSGSDGCFPWQDRFTHKYFIRERTFLKTFVVENEDMNLNAEIPLLINPWDFTFTFGGDARGLSEDVINDQTYLERPESEFYMTTFSYSYEGTRYEIDDLMRMTVFEKVKIWANPQTQRFSSQTKGRNATEPLRYGVYLIRFALRRNDYEVKEEAHKYIAGFEKLVEVIHGQFRVEVDIPFRDIRLQGSRNELLIEFSLVDESKVHRIGTNEFAPIEGETFESVVLHDAGLKPKTFAGPLIMYSEGKTSNVLELGANEFMGDTDYKGWLDKYKSIELPRDLVSEKNALPEKIENTGDYLKWGRFTDKAHTEFLKKYRYEFAEINHLSTVRFDEPDSIRNLAQYYGASLSQQSLTRFTEFPQGTSPENRFEMDIFKLIEDGQLSPALAAAFCESWYQELFVNQPGYDSSEAQRRGLLRVCKNLGRAGANALFLVGQRIEVHDVFFDDAKDDTYFGRHSSLSVRTGFSLSRGQSSTLSLGANLSWGLPAFVDFFTGMRFGVTGSQGNTWSSGSSNSMSAGTSIGLSIEENNFKLEFRKYRRCAVVRLHPEQYYDRGTPFFGFLSRWNQRLFQGSYFGQELVFHDSLTVPPALPVEYGYYVCGPEETDPIIRHEKYYYITQGHGSGYQQDRSDWRNRPFMISIRGLRDFHSFIKSTQAYLDYPEESWINTHDDVNLIQRLEKTFQAIPTSHPGLYKEPTVP